MELDKQYNIERELNKKYNREKGIREKAKHTSNGN